MNELFRAGFDVLFNEDHFYYNDSETTVKDAALWLLDRGYKQVFLFGFSGGGSVVACEIQKDYAPLLYSASVLAAAIVNPSNLDWQCLSFGSKGV